jgi:hypothetical protein
MLKILIVLLSFHCYAKEKSESFLVDLHDKKVKVTSPIKKRPIVGFIVNNHTLSTIHAKIATPKKDLKFFTIKSQKSKAFDIKINNEEKVYLVSISPPDQEIELVFDRKAYEIPAKE